MRDKKNLINSQAFLNHNYVRATLPTHIDVLVVDDDVHDVTQIKRFLSSVDHSVYTIDHASSIADATKLISDKVYHVVLLDYKLGADLGLGFLGVLGRLGIDVPVIMVSHIDSIDVDLQSLHVGCIDYLPKGELTKGSLERAIRYAINNYKILKELTYIASHDALTDMPNRALFFDRLKHALLLAERSKAVCAILSCDLDDFKLINDKYGHPVGDEVLIEFASRLGSAVRKSDTVARMGGDEFIILLENVNRETAESVANKIIKSMEAAINVAGASIHCHCSIGVTYFPSEDDVEVGDVTTIMKQVDRALYDAKAMNKGCYSLSSS